MAHRFRTLFAVAAALAGVAVSAFGAPARADVVPSPGPDLRPGQSFAGDVPPGETIRIAVQLAAGAKLRLQFTLQSGSAELYLPANFQRVSVTDQDGRPVAFDTARDAIARYDSRRRRSTFQTNDWPAPAGGTYTFSITHKTKILTRCTGKVKVIRTTRFPISGLLESPVDERSWSVETQPGDALAFTVRRRSGSAPYLSAYTPPNGTPYTPSSQKRTRKGATLKNLFTGTFGTATFVVGSQDVAAQTGAFKGTITLRPDRRAGRVGLAVVNPPGIDLSVRTLDAATDVQWATSGAGVDFDGQYVFITGEFGGAVLGKYYNADLTDPNPLAPPTTLVTSADFSDGTPVAGHRLASRGGVHYVVATNQGGTAAAAARFPAYPQALSRSGFAEILAPSSVPVTDAFAVATVDDLWVGVPETGGHRVTGYAADSLVPNGASASIGGAARPHVAGAGAVYRADQNVFEFWAPTASSTQASIPSDLSHGVFSASWLAPLAWEPARVAETATEVMSTAVVLDEPTGVTLVYYIEPTADASGFGILHVRLFDPLGVEVPGSHKLPLGPVRVRRPAAFLADDFVWLAAEGISNATVVRFELLRN